MESVIIPEQIGGNPLLKDMAVPTALLILQNTYGKESKYAESGNEVISNSLYDRLLLLAGDSEVKKNKTRKRKPINKRKTKRNN